MTDDPIFEMGSIDVAAFVDGAAVFPPALPPVSAGDTGTGAYAATLPRCAICSVRHPKTARSAKTETAAVMNIGENPLLRSRQRALA